MSGSEVDPVSPEAAHVPAAESGAYPLRPGNRIAPLVDGEPAFRRICRAIESAHSSAYITVAFIERDVEMPDRRGSFFDVLDRAVDRGIDVRVLFWREPRLSEFEPDSTHFGGSDEDRAWLAGRGSRFSARWDRLPDGFCQHQKSFLIDAGVAGEIAFVGGINLLRSSMAAPGHESGESDHDLYLEIAGPAASDVHHNFVQRWNEASDRDRPDARWSGAGDAGDLEYPSHLSRPAGEVPVQMTRTVLPRRYRDDTATPGGKPFAIAGGETSVREQYLLAISAARRSIYLENQAIGSPAVVAALAAALERRVAVTVLVPGNAHPQFVEARRDPRAAFFFEQLAALGDHENFTLAALARCRGDGHYDEIYVHAKVALIDDVWATIGSTNVADRSFANDTELNASFWHPASVRALRVDLFQEHLGRDTGALSDIEALALYRESAFANRDRRTLWEPLDGLVYAIDPADYGA